MTLPRFRGCLGLFPLILAAGFLAERGAVAAEAPAAKPSAAPPPMKVSAAPPLIVETVQPEAPPSPDYSGDLLTRQKLTGDWLGARDSLAESGITVDADVLNFYQGVTSGGRSNQWKDGTHADVFLNVDGGKLGLKGFFVNMHVESATGEVLGAAPGALVPASIDAVLPTPDKTALTQVLFSQFFSEHFGVFAGKMNALDGGADTNAFAYGSGRDQFLNTSLIVDPALFATAPYSALGAGFVVLNDKKEVVFSMAAVNPQNTITTSGISDVYSAGVALNPQLRLPVEIMGLPGHQLLGGVWNTRTFRSLDQDPRIILPGSNIPINPVQGGWSVYYNFDQYLMVNPCNPKQGWGVFGRACVTDGDPNPIKYFLSAGVGGDSPLRGRGNDTFGVGYYYLGKSSALAPLLNLRDGQGMELYYNLAVTPWFHLTPDFQVVRGGFNRVDTAFIWGLRAKVDF